MKKTAHQARRNLRGLKELETALRYQGDLKQGVHGDARGRPSGTPESKPLVAVMMMTLPCTAHIARNRIRISDIFIEKQLQMILTPVTKEGSQLPGAKAPRLLMSLHLHYNVMIPAYP